MNDRPVIAVLVSGSGSNLQAIIDASGRGEIPCRVGIVVGNKADAYGLVRARKLNGTLASPPKLKKPTRAVLN